MTDWIGREPDRLSLVEQRALSGKWIALEVYTPARMPLKRIAAVGGSASECMAQIAAAGLDPRDFEYRPYKKPA